MKKVLFFLPTALLASAATLGAATLIPSGGITATATNEHSAPFVASNTLDGLTLEGWTNLGTAGPPARPANHQNNHWITQDANLTATITFDLGGTYDLAQLEILNTSNTNWNDRETDTFTVETSTDGVSFGTPSASGTLQDYTLGFQTVALADTNVTHVRINVTNDPGAGTMTGTTADTAVGLNEVRFFQVPEPTAGVLGAIGFLLMLRRRRD